MIIEITISCDLNNLDARTGKPMVTFTAPIEERPLMVLDLLDHAKRMVMEQGKRHEGRRIVSAPAMAV